MKLLATPLTLAFAAVWGLYAALPAHAQSFSPIATLSCPASGSAASLNEPIYSFNIAISTGETPFTDFTYNEVYTLLLSDTSAFFPFFTAEANNVTYPTCTLGSGQTSITFQQVNFVEVSVFGYGAGVPNSLDPSATDALSGSNITICSTSFTLDGKTYSIQENECMGASLAFFERGRSGAAGRLSQGGR